MGKWVDAAKVVRQAMDAAGGMMTDEQAVKTAAIFVPWNRAGEYAVGNRVRYGAGLYKCLLAHTAQDGWAPDVAASLWVRIDDPAIEWPAWRRPTGATDAYPLGAKVAYNDRRWISAVDANVWEPGVYGWDEQIEEEEA